MTRLSNSAETGLADGTAVTVANSDDGSAGTALSALATTGGALTYSTTTPHAGTLNYRQVIGTTGNAYLRCASGLAGTTAAMRAYFLIESNALTGNTMVMRMLNGSSGSMGGFRLTSTLVPQFQNAAGTTVGSAGSALSLSTWYRFEAWVTPGSTTSTGRVDMRIYLGEDDTTPLLSYNSVAFNAGTALTPRTMEWGRSGTAAGAITLRTDDLVVDDGIGEAFIGPMFKSGGGAVPVVSTVVGSVTALRPASGTVAVGSVATGAATVASTVIPAAGSVTVTSTVSGAVANRTAAAGSVVTVSTSSGAVTSRLPSSGAVPVSSGAAGAVTALFPTTADAIVFTTASGAVTARLASDGTIPVLSAAAGALVSSRPPLPNVLSVTVSAPSRLLDASRGVRVLTSAASRGLTATESARGLTGSAPSYNLRGDDA